MIGNIIGGLFSKVVNNAEGILDKVITTDKERASLWVFLWHVYQLAKN